MQHELTPDQARALADRFDLRLIVQFGSTVSGYTHPESDIDIAVLPTRDRLSFDDRLALIRACADLFDVDDALIDVVDLTIASSLLMAQVATKGDVRFDRDSHQFTAFYVRALKQYIDEEDLRQYEQQYLQRQLTRHHE